VTPLPNLSVGAGLALIQEPNAPRVAVQTVPGEGSPRPIIAQILRWWLPVGGVTLAAVFSGRSGRRKARGIVAT